MGEPDPFVLEGATPLTPEETGGLIPTFVATRADLNIAEQTNIAAARRWVVTARAARTLAGVLDDRFVRRLHREMYADVWRWAGSYRPTERNIGIDPSGISVAVRDLMGDATYWLAPGASWITPERAVLRVHHRMVAIHPFPNGNGRHARLFADVLARLTGLAPFTWGGSGLTAEGPDRAAYLRALRAADRDPDDLDDLVRFARS
ncbi:mobile mystery protein B [Cellulomonas hominis]